MLLKKEIQAFLRWECEGLSAGGIIFKGFISDIDESKLDTWDLW